MFNGYLDSTNNSELFETANPLHTTVGAVSTTPDYPGEIPMPEGAAFRVTVFYICRKSDASLAAMGEVTTCGCRATSGNVTKIADAPNWVDGNFSLQNQPTVTFTYNTTNQTVVPVCNGVSGETLTWKLGYWVYRG